MSQKTLLLVDDDPEDQHIVRLALTEAGIQVNFETADSGMELLERFRAAEQGHKERLPDLVLLDFNMPVLDGISTLEKCRTFPDSDQVPILIFSTSRSELFIEEVLQRGAKDFLTKPVRFEEMVHLLKTTVETWLD